jgi:hypothetical protein
MVTVLVTVTGGSIVALEPFYEPDAFLNGVNRSLQGFSGNLAASSAPPSAGDSRTPPR